jgi:hypothetical protein
LKKFEQRRREDQRRPRECRRRNPLRVVKLLGKIRIVCPTDTARKDQRGRDESLHLEKYFWGRMNASAAQRPR